MRKLIQLIVDLEPRPGHTIELFMVVVESPPGTKPINSERSLIASMELHLQRCLAINTRGTIPDVAVMALPELTMPGYGFSGGSPVLPSKGEMDPRKT